MRRFLLAAFVVALVALAPAASPAAPVFFQGHYYETFVAPGVTWNAADVAASSMTFMGATGHLATLTSAAEDAFVDTLRLATPGINLSSFPGSELWIGGFQMPGSPEPFGGWQWVNGEGPIPGNNLGPQYANWLPGEPNNAGGNESHLAIGINGQFGWNDEGNLLGIHGYVVEWDVPEPGSLMVLGLGLAGLALRRRRRG